MKKGKLLMALVLLSSFLLAVTSCNKDNDNEVISGGIVDHSDPDAPKSIESKDLIRLETDFYLNNRFTSKEEHFFDFVLDKNTLEEKRTNISCQSDEQLLIKVQEIISEYKLVSKNGLNKVTSGLPPEYQPCHFKGEYQSGEILYFCEDNDPEASWANELYDLFAAYFEQKGILDLYPSKRNSMIKRFDIMIKENGIYKEYGGIEVSEKEAIGIETYLLQKSLYDDVKKEMIYERFILFPDDYYKNITSLIDKYNLERQYTFTYQDHQIGFYGFQKSFDENEASSEDKIDIYIEYEDGYIMNIETDKRSELEAMKPFVDELLQYLDSLFD